MYPVGTSHWAIQHTTNQFAVRYPSPNEIDSARQTGQSGGLVRIILIRDCSRGTHHYIDKYYDRFEYEDEARSSISNIYCINCISGQGNATDIWEERITYGAYKGSRSGISWS